MGTVQVLTAAKTLEYVNAAVVAGVIDETGELILTKQDGSTVDLGNVRATNVRPMTQADIQIDGDDPAGTVETITVTDDGTDTNTWVNRVVYQFRTAIDAVARKTTFFNEFGELRVAPHNETATAVRILVKEFPDNPVEPRSATVPVVELMDDRTNRKSLRAWLGDGSETRNGIKMSDVLVLAAADPVPAGTPAGTVIFRTT
jgi:hypothetical protein